MDDETKEALGSVMAEIVRLKGDLIRAKAEVFALREILLELEEAQTSKPPTELQQRQEDLIRHWHQVLLASVEDISPGAAALLDQREDDDV